MAKLQWDLEGTRYYENGVDHGVLYVGNPQASNNTGYDSGVAWNGLTTVTESPDGAEPNDLWADNIKYATLYSAETFGATIEAYTYPEEFAQCDGSYSPIPGLYFGQQERKNFGFCYRTNTGNDTGVSSYKLHIVYNCKASPSEKSYETINDSPDAITFSWEITTTPITLDNRRPLSSITIDVGQYLGKSTDPYYGNRVAAINALEVMLYGSENSEPALPKPQDVLTTLYNDQTVGTAAYTAITL